jgi:hypothetical protein
MNSKGISIATPLILFIGLIVGLVLITATFDSIGQTTHTFNTVNKTYAAPRVLYTDIVLIGQAATNLVVSNATGQELVPATNYSVTNYKVINGELSSVVSFSSPVWNGTNVNISYTYEPKGYAQEAGTRAVIGLIAIFGALVLIGFVLYKLYEDGSFDAIGIGK